MNTKRMMTASTLMLALLMGVTSCHIRVKEPRLFSNGPKVTEYRQLTGYEEIEVNGWPTVVYTQADDFSVKIEGDKDLVADIKTEVSGKTLKISNHSIINFSVTGNSRVILYITSPDLTAIRLNGSGDFISDKKVDTDKMDIILRGSGDIDVKDVICDRCHVELIGSGDIDVKRVEAQEASATLVGSGDIELGLRKVDGTHLSLKGSGDIKADFAEDCHAVDCELRGSGDITLKGQVNRFNKQKSGSGDIDTDKLTVR